MLLSIRLATLVVCAATLAGVAAYPAVADIAPPATTTTTTRPATPEATQAFVMKQLAKQLSVELHKIKPSMSFEELFADDLDLIETIMEIEDHFGILLEDEALTKAAGEGGEKDLLKALTVAEFTSVVWASLQQ